MYQIIFCTCPNQEVALDIAKALVESKLAACVNLLPHVTSVYYWQGKIEQDSEVLLKIKSEAFRFQALCDKIVTLHPYEVPEIVALDISQGNADYLRWLDASLER